MCKPWIKWDQLTIDKRYISAKLDEKLAIASTDSNNEKRGSCERKGLRLF